MSDRCAPRIAVATLARPAVASVTVRGQQGATGKAGPRGVTTGFGQVTYTNRTLEPDDVFEPGVRAQVLFEPDTPIDNELNRPFDTHVFWANNTIVPRARGDLYDIQVNLRVTADTAGGELRLDADVGSSLGPIASDTQTLFEGAGTPERVTFRLRIQVLDNFLARGCRLYLTSSVRVTTVSETVLVAPQSLQPDTLPPDPEAASPTVSLIAAVPLSGHRAVRPVLGGVAPASSSDPAQANTVLGITRGAALPGKPVAIAIDGPLEEPSWSWALGPVFVGDNGILTQAAPQAGFVQRVGVAVSPTTLVIQIGPAVVKS